MAPESIPEVRGHSFLTADGARVRIFDSRDPHLVVNDVTLEPCYITGPEILKLAEQGRALWEALSELCSVARPLLKFYPEFVRAGIVLAQTAATFDQDEAEPAPATVQGVVVDSCEWEEMDEDAGSWETDCGYAWYFEEGFPSENDMKFCCFCGKPLTEKRFQPEEEEEVCGETFDHDLKEFAPGVWHCQRCGAEIVEDPEHAEEVPRGEA